VTPSDAAHRMMGYIDGSPSPYHAARSAAHLLDAAGFTAVAETGPFPVGSGRWYVIRGGSLIAWAVGDHHEPSAGFHIVGAHTDSPNLRIKPRPDSEKAGIRQLGVEIYGGVLLNSWLNRDLGLSGRVSIRRDGTVEERLFLVDRPILVLPQLAIHLDRQVLELGLKLNPQTHMAPIWALDHEEADFATFLAAELDIDRADVLAWDAMAHDLTPSAITGLRGELIAAPRIDNLASSHAGTVALAAAAGGVSDTIPVLTLFDHEEVGSTSDTGAAGPILSQVLERSVLSRGGDREAYLRALAGSAAISADGAHATHPNYADRHEPEHEIALNGGPALKVNANLRYATTSVAAARVIEAADRAEVPLQQFVNRTDLPCGSTIGPITAAQLGISTADVGAPQLSMHSARELCGAEDPGHLEALLHAFLSNS